MKLIVFIMAIFAFAIGTAAFLPMGLLLRIANDLGITITQAGQIITGYALGVAIGAPIMTILLLKLEKKIAISVLIIFFIIGNLLSALSHNYTMLILSRILASLAHGAGFGIGAVYLSELVEKEKKNTAIAIMFSGMTIANIVGVPIGTFIGQEFGWRISFWFVIIFGLIALLSIIFLAPKSKQITSVNYKVEFSALIRKPVIIGLLTTIFGYAGVFMVFAYISPILVQVSGIDEKYIGLILILFGIGATIGNLLGGKLADKNLNKTLIGTLIYLMTCQILFGIIMKYELLAIIMIGFSGIASFIVSVPFQASILRNAKNAPNLSSSMNIAAFNISNALGTTIGGKIIGLGLSLNFVPLVAALTTSIGLALAIYNIKLSHKI